MIGAMEQFGLTGHLVFYGQELDLDLQRAKRC